MQENLVGSEKERYINRLFATIAPKYDLLNGVISAGRHKSWRRAAVKTSGLHEGGKAVDVATGTGDFVVELAKVAGDSGLVVGVDFCLPMLDIAREKLGVRDSIQLVEGNAESLPFDDDMFDCATIGFALRNVASVRGAVAEMARVVKPGGRVVSLEIMKPTSAVLRPLWRLCFFSLMPRVAQVFGAEKEPYDYLPESVARFHSREELAGIFEDCGLVDVTVRDLTLGLVCIHMGTKR